jgi:flagellar biosynthesis/type III secretory pathway protein FliH
MGKLLSAGPARERRIAAAVHEATERARALLRDAEEAARRVRADAEEGRARALAEAAERGRDEGLARAATVLARAAAARDRLLVASEREVAHLALEVAGAILGRALASDPSLVAAVAARAVSAARDRREVTLRVHPSDEGTVRAAASGLAALLARAPGLVLRADPAVPPGGAVVETEAGRVDASVEAQLALLARTLREEEP